MPGSVHVNGGWGDEGLAGASESLRARSALADAEYQREGARQAALRQLRAEEWHERAIAASVDLAEQRGELVSARDRVHGIGRTKQEAVSYHSAVADLEDFKRAADLRKRWEHFQQFNSERESADMSAPSEIDAA